MANFKESKIYPVIILTIVVLVSVSILLFINSLTDPVVQAQRAEEINNLLRNIYPEMDGYEFENEIYIVQGNGQTIGYAFITVGSGYGGDISILVGLNTDVGIKEVTIISHTETPGLGSRITEESFTTQFEGLTAEQVALQENNGEIDAISGATISSEAVVTAVREEMKEKIKSIK